MHTIEIETMAKSGSDGVLHMDIPVGEPWGSWHVTIQAERVDRPQDAEWPEGYFEKTFGSWTGEWERDQPTAHEQRETL